MITFQQLRGAWCWGMLTYLGIVRWSGNDGAREGVSGKPKVEHEGNGLLNASRSPPMSMLCEDEWEC